MIILDKVSRNYGKTYAVKDISLEFKKKETIAIIGSSGSGKSTLLRIINALEVPTSGHVLIDDKKLTQKNKRKLCLKIGMVFQAFNLFPHLNVQDNLIYAPVNILGMKQMAAIAKAEKLLKQFGLRQRITAFPVNLSGGQKQRVAICRALMMNPEIMLFDEPTSALDPENIKDIIEIISLLKSQMTMIVVTHHIKFAKAIADRIIFMNHGQVLVDQPAVEFFEKSKSHRARLFLENIGDLM
ncbi:amino acid ABC transporter ATP-binding protein [Candidatus Tisiphia endosymbiont of Neophilaenus lineatus]|uniref:amino acid ABC transporter ATP-binding protein n=1 Tax=Candidatus Tisiphia endosymbiont of Neophilaenus lineatus TaxID=3139336 RepID=UPI0035C97E7E